MVLTALPAHAGEVLKAGVRVAQSLRLYWWLSAGTALGLYRDGRLLTIFKRV